MGDCVRIPLIATVIQVEYWFECWLEGARELESDLVICGTVLIPVHIL